MQAATITTHYVEVLAWICPQGDGAFQNTGTLMVDGWL